MADKKTVLVVEDEAPAVLALGDVLKGEGFEVLTARTGKEGLATAIVKHPDMILADLKMPEMGGLEMVRELRNDTWGKDVPVMILTNVSDGTVVEEAQEAGAIEYFIKGDMHMEDIIARIRARLGMEK
ncbi:MAG TPA: response regulator [Candidatus Paceibacterota bacterium]|nr:response regulator [Candidatus Paceibacterota bacterium]